MKTNNSHTVVQSPNGAKRVTYANEDTNGLLDTFKLADDIVSQSGLNFQVVSEQTAFELCLLSLESTGHFIGDKFEVDTHR